MKIDFKYGLNDSMPIYELLLYGLQWLAISISIIIILGQVVASLHYSNHIEQVNYLQKLFFVTGVSLLIQIIWGHGLPLIAGPATVLLISIAASHNSSLSGIYSSIMVGGGILFLLGITGLFGRLKELFTPRVVAAILILIAFSLTPTIIKLIIPPASKVMPVFNLSFAFMLVIGSFVASTVLKGIWKATLIIWAMIAGSIVYISLFGAGNIQDWGGDLPFISLFCNNVPIHFSLEAGVLISFLISFLALSVNDLGSIQALGALIQPDNFENRITRGIAITGLSNVLAGIFGVIGIVNFSISPGVIASTRCASRFTLLPTGIGTIMISFLPSLIMFMERIPPVVIGSMLIYIMCSQISAGLLVAFNSIEEFSFNDGLTMGFPLMLGIIISFLPSEALNSFPDFLKPIIGNGFVMGVIAVLLMEHFIFKEI